ncbi:glycerol dehydrogenase [Vibrio quintilis]|uniref:Glycerol dehydrogenase n=1 Tax=Vibrio quintilis TaxID=1117707 RepID=A0A1M7YVR5_9VIBR|nr:glycerol dehydrogenase [Vibrio quintilis]SHO56678.1 Glycerol dehydrogenase [Vibrio quintilis]
MGNLPRTVTSPTKFMIGSDQLAQMAEYVSPLGNNAFILSSRSNFDRVESQAIPVLKEAGIGYTIEKFNRQCTEAEIQRLGKIVVQKGADVVVGVGGGQALDCAKAVAYYQKLPLVLYPTVASTDAPCTALSVIYTEDDKFERYLFLPRNPDVVVADTGILAAAPQYFFSAGVGDALATYFEARACYQADGVNLVLKRPSRTGVGLARLCYQLLSENVEKAMEAVRDKVITPALEQTLEATIYLSGVGAEAGGLAAAHAVNNGMSVIPDLHDTQHGEKVVFGLLTQLVLEDAPQAEFDEVLKIAKAAELPLTLKEMGLKSFIEADWRRVAEVACDEKDTMSNMPLPVSSDDVYQAMIKANEIAESYHMA